MSQDASIIARLGLDTAGFRKGLGEAKTGVKSVASELAAIGGISLSVAGVAAFASEILDLGGQLQDASDAIGVDVVALQELNAAFAQSGAGSEVVAKGLSKLSQTALAAREGNNDLAKTFDKLGVTMDDLRSGDVDRILMRIAASAGEAQDPSERLAGILDVLGKSGLKMAAGINSGAEALGELRRQAQTLSKEDIAVLDALGDRLERIKNGFKVNLAKSLINGPANFSEDVKALQAKGTLPLSSLQQARERAIKEDAERDDIKKTAEAARAIDKKRRDDRTTDAAKFVMEQVRAEQKAADALADMEEEAAEKKREEIKELQDFEARQKQDFLNDQAAKADKRKEEDKAYLRELADKGRELLAQEEAEKIASAQRVAEARKKAEDDFVAEKMGGPDAAQ
jgi:hypothetical protein